MALASEIFKGAVFHRYTVLENRVTGQRYVSCRCECGTVKSVQYDKLGKIDAMSCGCIKREFFTRHGMSQTRTYSSWDSMIQRCLNPKTREFLEYGGRGISVCERWKDFALFYEDMGDRPIGTSLDRVNNNGNYEPSNCRWATDEQQSLNKRSSALISAFGETKTKAEWLGDPRCSIARSTLDNRLRAGWPTEKAISEAAENGRNQWGEI